jgi:hypothetical protein
MLWKTFDPPIFATACGSEVSGDKSPPFWFPSPYGLG